MEIFHPTDIPKLVKTPALIKFNRAFQSAYKQAQDAGDIKQMETIKNNYLQELKKKFGIELSNADSASLSKELLSQFAYADKKEVQIAKQIVEGAFSTMDPKASKSDQLKHLLNVAKGAALEADPQTDAEKFTQSVLEHAEGIIESFTPDMEEEYRKILLQAKGLDNEPNS